MGNGFYTTTGETSDRWKVETSSAPIAKDTLCTVLQDMNIDLQRLNKVIEHLTIIGDRLEGSRPEKDAVPPQLVDAPPHSVFDELRQKRSMLQHFSGKLELAASRIDNIIGGLGN